MFSRTIAFVTWSASRDSLSIVKGESPDRFSPAIASRSPAFNFECLKLPDEHPRKGGALSFKSGDRAPCASAKRYRLIARKIASP